MYCLSLISLTNPTAWAFWTIKPNTLWVASCGTPIVSSTLWAMCSIGSADPSYLSRNCLSTTGTSAACRRASSSSPSSRGATIRRPSSVRAIVPAFGPPSVSPYPMAAPQSSRKGPDVGLISSAAATWIGRAGCLAYCSASARGTLIACSKVTRGTSVWLMRRRFVGIWSLPDCVTPSDYTPHTFHTYDAVSMRHAMQVPVRKRCLNDAHLPLLCVSRL